MDWKKLALEQAALIKQLQARIAELEAEIAMLRKNSSNSSKPHSSDSVKPPIQPKDKRKRKRGAQKGHKQHLRKPFDEPQVDNFVDLKLDACPTCGGQLVLSTEPPKVHQQVELADKPFVVTEFRQAWYWCEHCQCFHAAVLPSEVKKSGLFGPKLLYFRNAALTAYLKGRGHMSYTTLRDFYGELLERLPGEPHFHIDETGGKKNGQKRWTWCFRAGKYTLFHIDPSRGSIVLENLLGMDYVGAISCDF